MVGSGTVWYGRYGMVRFGTVWCGLVRCGSVFNFILRRKMMNDNSLMPFGQYRDEKLKDVPASYLLYLYDQESEWVEENHPELYDYIEDNLEALEGE